jgi:hypothetical protein
MSVRAGRPPLAAHAAPYAAATAAGLNSPESAMELQRGLQELRATNERVLRAANEADAASVGAEAGLTIDDLNEVERSAASLGVNPDALKPIGFMNDAHFDTLKKKNVLSGTLTQQLEAYKVIASADVGA